MFCTGTVRTSSTTVFTPGKTFKCPCVFEKEQFFRFASHISASYTVGLSLLEESLSSPGVLQWTEVTGFRLAAAAEADWECVGVVTVTPGRGGPAGDVGVLAAPPGDSRLR